MCFLSYPQLHTLFLHTVFYIIHCYVQVMMYTFKVECPVFPQKWGLNEKKISFRFSLGNSTRLDYLAHINFERDQLIMFRVRALTSSGSTGGRGGSDAKTILSPNTSFGDIIMTHLPTVHHISPQQWFNMVPFYGISGN